MYRDAAPKTWMLRVKLDCLKSSGKLETRPSPDTIVCVGPRKQHGSFSAVRNRSSENMVNETYHATNGHPTAFYTRRL